MIINGLRAASRGSRAKFYISEKRNFACAVSQGQLPLMAMNIPEAVLLATLQQGMAT
jgi:hypothetical protein